MFKFNLIPPERRRLKRTPLPYFIGIVILSGLLSVGVFDYLKVMQDYKKLQSKEKDLNAQIIKLKNDISIYDELIAKKTKLETRKSQISGVEAKKLIIWTKKIDEFLNILQKFPSAWIEDIIITTGGGEEIQKGKKILATMEIKMVMHTKSESDIINFREAIKNPVNNLMNGFNMNDASRFDYIPEPSWSKEQMQLPGAQTILVYKFPIKLVKFQPQQPK